VAYFLGHPLFLYACGDVSEVNMTWPCCGAAIV